MRVYEDLGGGAELLDDEIRSKVSPKKISGIRWLEIMGAAHGLDFILLAQW